ncbi:MAG: class I tRNA ligase family protein [Polyangiaceae bacterium]
MSAKARFQGPAGAQLPGRREVVLSLWKERGIFEVAPKKPAPAGSFVFTKAATANGIPHNGHVLTRVTKDLFPRYKTMRGYRVGRKAGWDTHGLPVEVEVEEPHPARRRSTSTASSRS